MTNRRSEHSQHSNKFLNRRNTNKEEISNKSKSNEKEKDYNSKDQNREINQDEGRVKIKAASRSSNNRVKEKDNNASNISNVVVQQINPFDLNNAVNEAKCYYANQLCDYLKVNLSEQLMDQQNSLLASFNKIDRKLTLLDKRITSLNGSINKAKERIKSEKLEENKIEGSINNIKPVKGGVKLRNNTQSLTNEYEKPLLTQHIVTGKQIGRAHV